MRRTCADLSSRGRFAVVIAAALGGGVPAIAQRGDLARPEWTRSFEGESAFTEPSRSAVMGFDQPTSIREVLVKGGEVVEGGSLLVRGDDAEELARYETQKIQVEDDLDVQRLEKIHDLRTVQYQKTKESYEQGRAAAPLELEERKVTMEVAGVELAVGRMEYEQAKLSLEMYKARVDRLRLYAPFDGIIEAVQVDVGESVGEEDAVLKIVNTDVLRMDVATDTKKTLELGLEPGDPAWVLVDAPGERRVYLGTITEVSPVAYYATRQRRVRVEVPNPEGWPAGLPAWVRFTEPSGEWAERVVRFEEPGPVEPISLLGPVGGEPALAYADRTFVPDRSTVRWGLGREGECTP